MTLDDVQNALVAWVVTASGLDAAHVLWDGQQGSAPEGMFCTLKMGDILALGARDEETQTTVQAWLTGTTYAFGDQASNGGSLWLCSVAGSGPSTDAPSGAPTADGYTWTSQGTIAGQEITIKEFGRRQFGLTVQCFGTNGQEAGVSSPVAVLSAVRSALALPTPRGLLNAVGVTCFDRGSVSNVPALVGTIYEPRAIFESQWYLNEAVTEQTGYIETVNVDGDLTDAGGSAVALDFTATSP